MSPPYDNTMDVTVKREIDAIKATTYKGSLPYCRRTANEHP